MKESPLLGVLTELEHALKAEDARCVAGRPRIDDIEGLRQKGAALLSLPLCVADLLERLVVQPPALWHWAQLQAMCCTSDPDHGISLRCPCEGHGAAEPRRRDLEVDAVSGGWLGRSLSDPPDEHAERGMAQVLARCWARRWGRGQVTTCKTQWPGSHSLFARWLGYYFTFLMLQSGVASPAVISLTFQQGVSNSEINVPAIISAQDVRLDSEAGESPDTQHLSDSTHLHGRLSCWRLLSKDCAWSCSWFESEEVQRERTF